MSWLTDEVEKLGGNVEKIKYDPVGTMKRGPKGWLGDKLGEIFQTRSSGGEEQGQINPNMSAGEVDPNARLGPLQDIRKKKEGRLAHNLNKRGGASILTTV